MVVHQARYRASSSTRLVRIRAYLLAAVFALGAACMLAFSTTSAYAVSYSEDAQAQLNATALRPLSEYIQTVYDDEDGLPGGIVNDVAQTADGVLWIGTYSGLYRFNGRDLERVSVDPEITSVNFLFVDSKDHLWVGTNDGGLVILDDEHAIASLTEKDGLPSNSVRSIVCDSQGRYYVGTTGALAVVTLQDDKLSLEATIPETSYVLSLSVRDDDMVAAVTEEGNLFLLKDAKVVGQIPCSVPDDFFTCVAFSPSGELYAGTSNQIIVYQLDGATATEVRSYECAGRSGLQALYFSPRNRLLICADNGVSYLDAEGVYHELDTGSFVSSIRAALVDYQGNVWFASSKQGLLKLSVSPFVEVYAQAGLPEKVVNAIAKWQGLFYFATDSGIDVVDANNVVQPLPEWAKALEGVRVRCVLTDSHDNLWVCTTGKGAWCVHPDGSVQVYDVAAGATSDSSRSMYEMTDGTIALASDNGITLVRDGAIVDTVQAEDGLENPKILCLTQTSDGTLLAGTDGDGIAVIKDGKVTDMLKEDAGLSSKIVMRMVPDSKGEGFFVVTSNALNFMDNDLKARDFKNLTYGNNYDIIAGPNDELFILGSEGVLVVNRTQLLAGDKLDYVLLDRSTGLRSGLTANAWEYVDTNGDLYLAGDNGVSKLNMNDYDKAPVTYLMDVRSVTADGTEYTMAEGEELTIPRQSQRVVIEPEVMNYTANDPYVYTYLEGFDAEPQIQLQSELKTETYTNLPPGEYVYHLAILDVNKQTLTENTYPITKKKEIYDELWFNVMLLALFALLVGLAVWAVVRWRMQKKLAEKQRELEIAQEQIRMANQAILTIARTVDAKDANTSEHSFRVSEYSTMIAKRLGLSDDEVEEVRRTALLHDIGKIGIPDKILNKPGRLTDEEYEVMKTHPVLGGKILSKFTSVNHIIDGAQYHHERYDGHGYPEGLAGEDIPFMARIIGTADAFDAMTANRVYRKKLDMDDVLAELKRCRGTQFDPKMLDALLELIDDGTIDVEAMFAESQANPEDRVSM